MPHAEHVENDLVSDRENEVWLSVQWQMWGINKLTIVDKSPYHLALSPGLKRVQVITAAESRWV